jgi:hypothetical protein
MAPLRPRRHRADRRRGAEGGSASSAVAIATPGRTAAEPGSNRLRTVRRMATTSDREILRVKSAAGVAEEQLRLRQPGTPPPLRLCGARSVHAHELLKAVAQGTAVQRGAAGLAWPQWAAMQLPVGRIPDRWRHHHAQRLRLHGEQRAVEQSSRVCRSARSSRPLEGVLVHSPRCGWMCAASSTSSTRQPVIAQRPRYAAISALRNVLCPRRSLICRRTTARVSAPSRGSRSSSASRGPI